MSSNLPAVHRRDPVPASYSEAMQVGATLAASGFFTDARSEAQAAAKVIAGMELGLGPMASMTGIHLVQGKVTLSANLIAGLIKRSGRYDYRVVRMDAECVEIAFFDNGDEIGRSVFTKADAQAAGLWGKAGPWKQHPRNMLFARAMSNGAKWYTPDVFAGPVYTPDELGATVDGETGEVIELPAPEPKPGSQAIQLARKRYAELKSQYGKAAVDAALNVLELTGPELADDDSYARVVGELAEGASEEQEEAHEVISEAERRALHAAAAERGLDHDGLKALAREVLGVESTTLIPPAGLPRLVEAIEAKEAA